MRQLTAATRRRPVTLPPGARGDDKETYTCYLCTGRNPLLIRICPICWDLCHLVCWDDPAANNTDADHAAAPAAAPGPSSTIHPQVHGTECYVMKLYEDGSYKIVLRRPCRGIQACNLSCGGGDDVVDRNALGAAAGPVTPTAPPGMPPLPTSVAVDEFTRCGDQLFAPRAAVPGV